MRRTRIPSIVRRGLVRTRQLVLPLVVAGLTVGLATGVATAAPLFPNPVYPVGSNPYGMVKADFTGDGIEDLIVSNFANGYDPGPGDLSFLRGRGDGTFADEVRIPIAQHPFGVLTADFTGDGRADLVVGYSDRAVLLAGQGDGTFGAETPLTAAGTIAAVRLAHINADSLPDLLVVGTLNGASYAQALLGDGHGGFTQGPVTAPGTYFSAIADVNGDGLDDYLAIVGAFQSCGVPSPPTTQVNDIQVFIGHGDGSFSLNGSFSTGAWTDRLIPADLDGDGKVDLVIDGAVYQGCSGYSARTIYFGNGDGTFVAGSPVEVGSSTSAILTGDLNGDGIGDYVDINMDAISIFLGRGNRTFAAAQVFYASTSLLQMVGGDFDRNGKTDLAILSNWGEAVFIFAGNGDGTFGPPAISALQAAGLSAAADVNGDGILDIVATGSVTNDIDIVLGNGDGTFRQGARFPLGVGAQALSIADFNNDGKKDIAVALLNWADTPPPVYPNGSLAILLGDGDGTFQPVTTYDSGQVPLAMVVADVNGDGVQDVIVANWGDGVTVAGDLSLYLGRGDGTMSPQTRIPVGVRFDPIYDPTVPVSLAVGDFNQDGRRDLVVGMRGTYGSPQIGEVEILFGNGDGTFRPEVPVLQVTRAEGVAVGDLNHDGHDDIAVADPESYVGYAPGGLYVLLGHGDGTFAASGPLAAGVGPYQVEIQDFNRDGMDDLAASNNGGYLALLPGNGDGTFGPRLNFAFLGVPLSIAEGDFNGDGSPDLMVVSSSGAFLFVNRALPPLAVDVTISAGSPLGKGSGTVRWTTNGEWDLLGFNIVAIDNRGRHQLNAVLIPCGECTTGLGSRYADYIPKHKSGRDVFIEALHTNGGVETFGPARRQ